MKRIDIQDNLVIILRPKSDSATGASSVFRPTILICDDEPELRALTCEQVKELRPDAIILEASDGNEGLAKYIEFKPQVILTDLHMPKTTGLQMTSEIRKTDKKVHIVLMSGFADKSTVIDFMRLGASDVIDKPVDVERLDASLATAIPKALSKEARYTVPQFIEIMRPILSKETATRQSPHQLVKRYNAQTPNILATVGIKMPSGEIIEVKADSAT